MTAVGKQTSSGGVSKKARYGPAVFVERNRAKTTSKSLRIGVQPQTSIPESRIERDQTPSVITDGTAEERRLKKPGVKSRARSPQPRSSTHTPLPISVQNPHNEDMAKIASDMNDWVMREIGSNLQSMEHEKQAERPKFKPKVPAKRYQDRHPASAIISIEGQEAPDAAMTDVSDMEDDEEWVIEEYVRIPAHAMTSDVAEADVGVLVLEGEADSNLFYGPEQDEEDDLDEDDEDENGMLLRAASPPANTYVSPTNATNSQLKITTRRITLRMRLSPTMNTDAILTAIAMGTRQMTRNSIMNTMTTATKWSLKATMMMPPWPAFMPT